jgi:hypothetical protein
MHILACNLIRTRHCAAHGQAQRRAKNDQLQGRNSRTGRLQPMIAAKATAVRRAIEVATGLVAATMGLISWLKR